MDEFRIIIVDTDLVWRRSIKNLLTSQGCQVVGEADNAPGALKLVRTREPDLLIIDANLPGKMEGIQIAKIVHEDKLAPVIITSVAREMSILEQAKDSGAFALLVKPIEISSLLLAIDLAVNKYREIIDLEQKIKSLEERLETRKLIEQAKGILMEKQGLTEAEAFKRLQRQSMNKRINIRLIAEAVVMVNTL